MRDACALDSFALVATRPIVVFSPGRGGSNDAPPRRMRRASASVPSAFRAPATTAPVSGLMMSPTELTATIAATTRPFGSVIDAVPMPAFIGSRRPDGYPVCSAMPPSFPTVAPAPAPTDPS
jgi:hypothetical protein